MTPLRGITWSHPRGFAPLEKLAELAGEPGPLRVDAPQIVWSKQNLSGFESTSIADLAHEFDLIVLDHPGLGAAVAEDALEPLDDIESFRESELTGRYVSGSLEAYRYEGRQYAIPIDAATQVSAWAGEAPASSWEEVLSRQGPRWALPTKSPHAILSLLGVAASIEPGFLANPDELIPTGTGRLAFETFAAFVRGMPATVHDLDPIEILELMSNGDVDASPLLYGYVTYARSSERHRMVQFADAPAGAAGAPGCVLGGTGIALSRHSRDKRGALQHMRQIAGKLAQTQVVGQAGGQPADAQVWAHSELDAESGSFYSATVKSQTSSIVRPRYDGWIAFQHRASALVLEAALSGRDSRRTTDDLNALHRDAVASSRSAAM
jgi:multiple sugar transport system substrate-binding protein